MWLVLQRYLILKGKETELAQRALKVAVIFGPFPFEQWVHGFGERNDADSRVAMGVVRRSTNAPILYPNSASMQELEPDIITISPTTLPDGANNAAYPTTQFSATGGPPPYFWSLGAGAPPGLTLSTDGEFYGTPDGNAGPYDFTIQLTDSSGAATQSPGRVVTLNYTITIH